MDFALTLDSFLRSVSVILARTFIWWYFLLMFPEVTFLIASACYSWSFVFFLATFIYSVRAFANSSLFLIGFRITLGLKPESIISSSTLLLGVVASLWFWNEEDLEVDPDVDEADGVVVLEDMVEFFSSFSEVACKAFQFYVLDSCFHLVTFPQLSFFYQLTISHVFHRCYSSLVDENQVQPREDNSDKLGYGMCHFLRVLFWLKSKFLSLFYSL